jgi:hypothetical protein
MNELFTQIDDSTAWAIAAALATIALSAFAGWFSAKMEIKYYAKKKLAADEARRAQWIKAVYHDIDIPAFQREAKHPLDSVPYDIRKMN